MTLDLFGTGVTIHGENFANIPLITNSNVDDVEVLVPGHIYSPVLVEHRPGKVSVGPGALIESEKQFVCDLLSYICPNGDCPKHPSTPIIKNGIEYYLRRNIDSNDGSARFRIDAENWFYPDFVLWIVDPVKATQTVAYIDPKGLRSLEGGWRNHKILSALYSVVEAQVSLETGKKTIKDSAGKRISLRLAAAIISTTKYDDLVKTAEYDLAEGRRPTVEEFNKAGIWFPDKQSDYIEKLLDAVNTDNDTVGSMRFAAKVWAGQSCESNNEMECYLAGLICNDDSDEKSAVLNVFLRASLGGGSKAAEACRSKLTETAKKGKFGFGATTAASIRDNPTPCRSWWDIVREDRTLVGIRSPQPTQPQLIHASASDV